MTDDQKKLEYLAGHRCGLAVLDDMRDGWKRKYRQ
jgi:hypothetical protein